MENTKMNTEKTPYALLKEKLDDPYFAQKFFDEKEAEAKEYIERILSVCLGWSVPTEDGNEWAHELLFKILDMFMIRHENFSIMTLAEHLQFHIFNYTLTHDEAYREWKKGWDVEDCIPEKLGKQNEQPVEAADIKNESAQIDSLAEHTFSITANKIGHVLSSDKVSDDIKNAVIGVMYAASNESGVGFDDSPEIAKASFPVIMRALDISAQRAYLHSIEHLLGESLPESIVAELKQYEVRFDTKKPHDDLKSENRRAAEGLSEILNNPNIPVELRNGILKGLTETKTHAVDDTTELLEFQHSPEYIERLLNLAEVNND
jgi:hypothetical protein